jgi:hypothetical protein
VPTKPDIAPHPADNAIECWLYQEGQDPGHADFRRARPGPRLFLLRGYQEDSPREQAPGPPGTLFDLTIPVWRVGEVLLHAHRLNELQEKKSVQADFQFRWTGLAGRTLTSWSGHRVIYNEYKSRQNEIDTYTQVAVPEIRDRLPEIVQRVTRPLYELFDFFSPPPEMFVEELAGMRSKQF